MAFEVSDYQGMRMFTTTKTETQGRPVSPGTDMGQPSREGRHVTATEETPAMAIEETPTMPIKEHPALAIEETQATTIKESAIKESPATGIEGIKHGILANRGVEHPENYSPKNLIPPSGLADGEKAARRIAAALIRRQKIIVVADFDCDGIAGASIMMKGLMMLAEGMRGSSKKRRPTSTASADQANQEAAHQSRPRQRQPRQRQRPDIQYIIPDRLQYGHGLSSSLATEVIQPLSADLIITSDNGMASHAAVDLISSWTESPDVIITDHHPCAIGPTDTSASSPGFPNAYAVVNPVREDHLFASSALNGTGVAFSVIALVRRAIVELIGENPGGEVMASRIKGIGLNHLFDLVFLGTVAGKATMDKNNRLMTKIGLERINKGYQMTPAASHSKGLVSYGVRAILEQSGVTYPVTTTAIMNQVRPRLNSASRATTSDSSVGIDCLLADTPEQARHFALQCDNLNTERRQTHHDMTGRFQEQLRKIDLAYADQLDRPNGLEVVNPTANANHHAQGNERAPSSQTGTVIHDDSWPIGVTGIIASHMSATLNQPVVCFAPEKTPPRMNGTALSTSFGSPDNQVSGEPETLELADPDFPEPPPSDADVNWLKGAGHSDSIHIRDALTYVSINAPDLMMQFSGHDRAASITLYRHHLPRFRRLFSDAVAYLHAQSEDTPIDDGPLLAIHRSFPFAHWIERQPWGVSFPEPRFTQTFRVIRSQTFKQAHQHLIVVDSNADPADGQSASAEPLQLLWFFSVNDKAPSIERGEMVTFTYRFHVARVNGRNTLQGTVLGRSD